MALQKSYKILKDAPGVMYDRAFENCVQDVQVTTQLLTSSKNILYSIYCSILKLSEKSKRGKCLLKYFKLL